MEILTPEIAGRLVLPWESLPIMPIGDIQYSGGGASDPADLARLRRHVDWGVANGAYFIGMGDYIDFVSPSGRRKLRGADLYDMAEDSIDRLATGIESEVLAVLAKTEGRWLGWAEGHHWYQHLDGTTTGQRFAKELGGHYLGDCGFMRLDFRGTPASGRSAHTKILIHHGHGGAASGLLAARKYEMQAKGFAAQLFFIGHHHTSFVYRFPMLDINATGTPHLFHQTRAIVLTGSFMRGYLEGNKHGGRPAGSYVEQGFMPPVALGGPLVTLTPKYVSVGDGQVSLVDVRGSV